MKILNLYAGIGGNRKLWTPNGDEHEITAVEYDKDIADVYADFFPKDRVLVEDAHEYLRLHHKEYDFIWSSPPCQSHSSFRFNINVRFRGSEEKYPDMKLYEEILFLKHHATAKWVVENVNPYYEALIPAQLIQRHMFWSNFPIVESLSMFDKDNIRSAQIPQLSATHGFDLSKYKLKNKRQVLRNCVSPQLGKYILDKAVIPTP